MYLEYMSFSPNLVKVTAQRSSNPLFLFSTTWSIFIRAKNTQALQLSLT